VEEKEHSGQIRVKAFYTRRAGRLLPALVVSLALTTTIFFFASTTNRVLLFASSLAGLLYVSNIMSTVLNTFLPGVNYTWSLAQEGQFYLVAPKLLQRLDPSRYEHWGGRLVVIAALLATGRIGLCIALPGLSVSTYHNPILNSDSMLLGTGLALLLKNHRSAAVFQRFQNVRWGVLAVTGCLVSFRFGSTIGYRLGFGVALTETCATVLIVHLLLRGPLVALFDNPFVRWVGDRSYAFYVYQIGVLALLRHETPGASKPILAILTLAGTFLVGAVSTRYLEQPFKQWARLRSAYRDVSPEKRVRRSQNS
jgi:peptidoglycan/LPS O-acetylase OafA/YrhL